MDRNFLGVVGSWSGVSIKVGLLNVYAPQSSSLKAQLWSTIEGVINSIDAIWILFGDFNVVRSQDERLGSSFEVIEASFFNDFIARAGLFDFPLGGRRFTRFDKNGRSASKLDRFLVSNKFFDFWNDAAVFVLCRSLSDHYPIALKVGLPNFGPKPFRIFDKWIGVDGFSDIISTSWTSHDSSFTPDLALKNKLKRLRQAIKVWTSNQTATQNYLKDELFGQLLRWDERAEQGLINDDDISKREEWIMDLNNLDQIHRNDLKQKCRLKWAVEGDENTRFFHSLLKYNYSKFNIKGIHVNGVWCESPNYIKQAALDHFSSRFKENDCLRPTFSSPFFCKLSPSDVIYLYSIITMEEVKEAVWGCAGSKAPGPDGFNFNFIKSYWEIIKQEFWDCIKYFESMGKISNGCNPSFIVLVPKKVDTLDFSDYCPISLIGCVYKVLSKILSNRLAKVIASVISPNQSAFIAGRKILDGNLIANEVIRMASIENLKLLLFKVDFEKAFDSVNWNFLLDIMRQMGFSLKWRKWISSCLSSASISVLINGSPSKEFKLERGLRQGDPLSQFLFLIVAEALQIAILEACDKGFYKGVYLAENRSNISLMQYADDALFFGDWSRHNALNLIHILKCFELASGLKVNIAKSRLLGVGVPSTEVELMALSLGCAHESLPFTYLGLPVGKKMRACEGWNTIISRVRDKLSSLKAKSLSIGGRLTLVKSVLGSLPIYYLSLFKAPQKVINILEAIRCRFFWGFKDSQRGISWVKWNTILLDRDKGGLGVGSLSAKNLGLLGKWKWRFLTEKNALWRQVISEFYGNDGGFGFLPNSCHVGGIWHDIIKATYSIGIIDSSFNSSFIFKVSNGSNTLFWHDHWCGDGARLMDSFPRLYALENIKDCKVMDRWCFANDVWGGNWSWRIPPRGRAIDDLSSLISLIGNLSLDSNEPDKWSWTGDASGKFKVNTLVKSIQNLSLGASAIGYHHFWNHWIPRKVNICVWRSSLNRLPTRGNLVRRGVDISSSLCPFCDNTAEEIEHCIINCPRAFTIWRKVWCWWGLNPPLFLPSFTISDIASNRIRSLGCDRLNKVLHGVISITIWALWKWRNRIVNAVPDLVSSIREEDIFPSIQTLSKLWISARFKSHIANWNNWVSKPFDLFQAP